MTRRRLILRVAGAGAVLFGGLLLSTGPASAASAASVQSGWWNEASAGPVAAPTTASSGQLQVSSGIQGPLAFAAVRVEIPADIDPAAASVTLTLVQVANSAVGTTVVSACPTTSSWKPGSAQAASSAPGYDCTKGKEADAIDSDGQDTFDIPAGWASGSDVALAIVPTPGTTAPFSVQYTAPTTRSVLVTGPPAAPTTSTPPTSELSGSGSTFSAAGGGSGPSSPDTAVPSAPVSIVAPDAGAAVALPSSGLSTATPTPGPSLATSGAIPAPASNPPGGGPASPASATPASRSATPINPVLVSRPGRTGRILAVSVLLLLGVVMFGLSGYSGRPPRLLRPMGGFGEQAGPAPPVPAGMGGIGRFAKPRTGPPRRL